MTIIPATPTSDRSAANHQIDLTIGRHMAHVRVAGELDLASVPALTRLLDSLNLLIVRVGVDMATVTFIDTTGITPLADAARRRHQLQLPPVLVVNSSSCVRRLLDLTHLGGNPHLDLTAWDQTPALTRNPR